MAWLATKYAGRSVTRNIRRTVLSILGIGIGCALALFTESMNRGRDELVARMGAYSGAGHIRVVPRSWPERRDTRLRLANWNADLAAARRLEGVTAATARSRAQVLLAMGSHVVPVEMIGVDQENEPKTNRLVQRVQQGRYLQPEERGATVIGKGVAERLHIGLGDDLLASAVGNRGDIESAMFRVVGIVTTGSEEIDAGICHVAGADLEHLTGLSGAGEIALVLSNWQATDQARAILSRQVAPGDEVLTWSQIVPELAGHIEQDKATARFVSVIILLIVLLGVASAQLAAVLERRREFAVLSGLGMSKGKMIWLMLQEALAVGFAGAVVGLGLGLPLVWWLATKGLDFRRFLGASYTFEGVLMEPVIYGDAGVWIVPYVLAVSIGVTTLASLYPAWFAARTDPAQALRVAQ
jgi:ABC-type lipoprotein release transport system permease subunit